MYSASISLDFWPKLESNKSPYERRGFYSQPLQWWETKVTYRTTGIFVRDRLSISNLSILLFSFSRGDAGCSFNKLSKHIDSSLFSWSPRCSCIVWRRNVTCLGKENKQKILIFNDYKGGGRGGGVPLFDQRNLRCKMLARSSKRNKQQRFIDLSLHLQICFLLKSLPEVAYGIR